MSTTRKHVFSALLLIGAIAIMVPQHALAAGTASGTTISNKATVNYSVGAVAQTPIESSPTGNSTPGVGNGTATTFTVVNKVNVTVTQVGNATVIPGSTSQVLVYTVTNSGNTAQRYALSTTLNSGFAMNNIRIYKDTNANGILDAGDVLYVDASTFGDIPADGVLHVLIVADTPSSVTNGQTAVYNLIATTVDAGTTTVTTPVGGVPVFADAAGSATGDVARDGKHSATATYTVNAATMTVTKTSAVYSDPFNGTTSPKAIPGAVITYTVTVANAAGGANATGVAIADSLATEIGNGHLAFKTQFVDAVNNCAAGSGIVVNATCNTNAGGDDNGDWSVTTPNTVTVSNLTVNAGTTATIKFQVTVQ